MPLRCLSHDWYCLCTCIQLYALENCICILIEACKWDRYLYKQNTKIDIDKLVWDNFDDYYDFPIKQ